MTETESKWTERVQQWKQSGQSASAFAEGKEFKASTLVWWGRRLRRGEHEGAEPSIPMARVVTRPRAVAPSATLVIELHGARVMLQRGFDAELLTQVVRALGGAR